MKNGIWTSLLLVAVIAMSAMSLTACGGGGGGGPINPAPNPTDPPDPTTPPPDSSRYSAGPYAISGIDEIPQSMVKLTREEMQRKFIIADLDEEHGQQVGTIACQSYIQSGDCDNHAGKIRDFGGTVRTEVGTSPFTKLVSDDQLGRSGPALRREDWAMMDRAAIEALFESIHPSERDRFRRSYWAALERGDQDNAYGLANVAANEGKIILGLEWLREEMRNIGDVKIVVWTSAHDVAARHIVDSYLTIHSAGNGTGDLPWYDITVPPGDKLKIAAAVRKDLLIFTAGWDKDANGNYVQHAGSSNCKGDDIQEGCVWTRFHFHYGGGTSYSAPQFAAALASVLAIAPETTPQNLAKFGKACVKKSGEGIEELLRISGGLGVADFACVGDVITAMANLPTGGTTQVTVNGKPVTLSGREIVLSFADGMAEVSEEEETGRFFFSAVPNGKEAVLFVAGYRHGDLFVLIGAGTREDFFGFTGEHRQVFQSSVTAGHENLFLSFTEQRSDGGRVITGATGQSLSVTAQKTVPVTEKMALTLSASADRFLGGEASIPLGRMTLTSGDWQPRLSLAAETEITSGLSLTTRAEVTDGKDHSFTADLRLIF